MFYKTKKKTYVIAILLAMAMIAGGYALGIYIGQNEFKKNSNKGNDGSGFQTIGQGNQNPKETEEYKIPSPNTTSEGTSLIFEINYRGCQHKKTEKRKTTIYEVGLTRREMEGRFPEWNIDEFSAERVILAKEIDDCCPEHFIIKDRGGIIVIYMPSEENDEWVVEETGVSTDILPYEIQVEIIDGLIMDSLEDVEHFMENLES